MSLKSCEKIETNIMKLEIEVDADTFAKACDASFRKNVKNIAVPGFRKGKAPRKMIEKVYGEGFFYEDAINAVYPEVYSAALEEAKIEPVDKAQVELNDVSKDGFCFTATVTVMPEVFIGEYKGIKADKIEAEVEDAEVESELERRRERSGRLVTAERAAVSGDTVVIDYVGYVDDKPFDGGSDNGHNLKLGSNSFIPGFEDQLAGATAGDDIEVNVTFPEEYHSEELAGREAVFKVKVIEVKETVLPDLDDEFVKDVSEFDTLDELKENIKKRILERKAASYESAFEEMVMDGLLEGFSCEIPPVMIDTQVNSLMQDFSYRLGAQGMSMESYIRMTGMDEAVFKENMRPQAERQVKIRLALVEVAKREGFEVGEEDIEKEYERMSSEHNMPVDEIKKFIAEDSLKKDLLVEKAAKLVRESAEVTMKKIGDIKADENTEDNTEVETGDAEPKPKKTRSKAAKPASGENGGEEAAPKKKTAKKVD